MNKPQTALADEMPLHVLEWVRQFAGQSIRINVNAQGFVTIWTKEEAVEAYAQQRCAGLIEALEKASSWPQIEAALAQFKGENVDAKR